MIVDAITRAELGGRWAYRAGLEHAAALRFDRLAADLAAAGFAPDLIAIARDSAAQERHHVTLCQGVAARFDATLAPPPDTIIDIAPRAWAARDRVVYDVIASCCIAETSNAAMVTAGHADTSDRACRRAVHTILADEIQHSRLGWRFLATHPLDDRLARDLTGYLPVMLRATAREELFRPQPELGDVATLRRFGTLPIVDRQAVFLAAMRAVVLPGLAAAGLDISAGAAVLDRLEAAAHAPAAAIAA